MNESELKSVVGDLVNKLASLVKINISKKKSDSMVKKFYQMGHDDIEVNFGLNITQDSKELAFLKEYTFELIKGFSEDMKDKLRGELSRGLLNKENQAQLSKRVSKVMDISRQRATAIVRTETNRMFNKGRQSAAERSGLKLQKYLIVKEDERTSGICKRMHNKYGTPDKAIPLDKKFIDSVTGERFDTPPLHISCRTRVGYTTKPLN